MSSYVEDIARCDTCRAELELKPYTARNGDTRWVLICPVCDSPDPPKNG